PPAMSNGCAARLEAGQTCTLRLRADGNNTVGTLRVQGVELTATNEQGASQRLEGALISLTSEPTKIPDTTTTTTTTTTSSSGGGGATGFAALLLLPLAWLRRRR
ncbi:GlyGly-CTERM sorting domain-containing protein, partial [Aeromonas hydrophila]|uniref:GlyGly-CTERM sorting domain-containing protein n=1 Tax=Aeromonas hydrophila TaxID=644 RepID=UPI000F52EF5C